MSMLLGRISRAHHRVTDPYWANVVSLLHFNGAQDSTGFTDETGKVWTPRGNAKITTAQSKFGGASGDFDGVNSAIESAASTDYDFGTGDFTIEGFIRPNRTLTDQHVFAGLHDSSASGVVAYIAGGNGGVVEAVLRSPSIPLIRMTGVTPIPINADFWHVELSRVDGIAYLFVRGSLEASAESGHGITASDHGVIYGCTHDSTSIYEAFTDCQMDEWRVTKGVGRHTASFTPPTAPFPNS